MSKKGKNLDDLQDINRAHIIRYLALHEGCSRVDLAKATGLKQASITKIIHSLMDNGVVSETGFTEGLKGRRSIGLALNGSNYQIIGVKLSWERLSIRVFDLKANTYGDIVNFSFGYLHEATADIAVKLVAETVSRMQREHPNVIAVGMAVPGPFHRGDGTIYIPSGEAGKRVYYPLFDRLRDVISLPVIMDHDANAGGLAYWWFKTDCDAKLALLYILASEGVGGGVVAKGQIFTGQRGHSAEMGHIVVELGGRKCICGGHGCLDAYSSSVAVEQQAAALLPRHPESPLNNCKKIDIDRILEAMRGGDAFATELIRDAGRYIGIGLASLIPVFDPDLIVVGDLMAGGGETLLEGIHAAVDENLSGFYQKPRVVLADTDDDWVLLGSAAIAIDRIFESPGEYLIPKTEASAAVDAGS